MARGPFMLLYGFTGEVARGALLLYIWLVGEGTKGAVLYGLFAGVVVMVVGVRL